MDKKLPERKQANLRYETWKKLMRIKLNLNLGELSDVIEKLYSIAVKIEPKLK